MPIARGWGTGGLQITFVLLVKQDMLKVIDQGADESVNAVNIKKLVHKTTGVETTYETSEATIIQSTTSNSRSSINRKANSCFTSSDARTTKSVEPSEFKTKKLHAENDYSGAWLMLFEQIMKYGKTATDADHPV